MKYKIKEGVVWEEINGEITVLDPEQGKYFILNKTAGEVWKKMKKSLGKTELIGKLGLIYMGGEKKIFRETEELLENLVKMKILKKVN